MRRHICVASLLAILTLLVAVDTSHAQWFGVQAGRFGVGIGRPYYDGWYGYYPGYSSYYYGWGYPYRSYYYSPGYYNTYSYGPWWSSYPSTTYYSANPTYQSFYQGPQDNVDMAAQVRVMVPANARVWIDDKETAQGGTNRLFVTPALPRGRDYAYDLKAQWREPNGKEVTMTRHVPVHAGDVVNVDFLANTGPNPAEKIGPAENRTIEEKSARPQTYSDPLPGQKVNPPSVPDKPADRPTVPNDQGRPVPPNPNR
jgi:uncharacterized protein (TIGR03000 family)